MAKKINPPVKKESAKRTWKAGESAFARNKDLNSFGDPSDFLAANYSIHFFHVPTGTKVKFKALVTSFSDSYQSNWNTDDTYGRMDPITTFQNTARVITIEWDVVAAHKTEAKNNMANCEKLFKMLYPSYTTNQDSAGALSAAPVFKVKFGNLISKAGQPAQADVKTSGLMGTMGGFEYSPDFDAGFFLESGAMYPQTISLSAEFQVIHNFKVGWSDQNQKFRTDKFPYGSNSHKSSVTVGPPAPSVKATTGKTGNADKQANKKAKKMSGTGKRGKK